MDKPKICVVMFPRPSKGVYKFLSDILKILEPLSGRIYVITGNTNRVKTHNMNVIFKDTKVFCVIPMNSGIEPSDKMGKEEREIISREVYRRDVSRHSF